MKSVPGEGFEPPTNSLQNCCTTPVLTRRIKDLRTPSTLRATTWPPTFTLQAVAHGFNS